MTAPRFYNASIARAWAIWGGIVRVLDRERAASLVVQYVEAARADGCPGSDLTKLARELYEHDAPDPLAVWVEQSALLQDLDRLAVNAPDTSPRTTFYRACTRFAAEVDARAALASALAVAS